MTQIAINTHCKPRRRSVLSVLKDAISLNRQRRTLARLDDRALEDIGVTRRQAQKEAERPVWDAPQFWHK
ncbi:DUF1127 domain-containing protein [Ruegeria halocynthiae]|uniref:DUF1127 domain-containing protein n=1 Tax=Ruegeria halocynthiae TaxID=985054 RepID=UPI000559E318|nr:DUF1127 domain-containing protein [Ruegeria halocynthiae]